MAFLLTHLSPHLVPQSKSKCKPQQPSFHHTLYHQTSKSPNVSSLLTLHTPPRVRGAGVDAPTETHEKRRQHHWDDFYVNLGLAVRTLREDMPSIFTKDLNYDIYRDDITFVDPLNTFTGIENYKLMFWALRFHGKILFREISVEVYRIWQPSENVILIGWNLRGVPRVPWEAKGQFQGTSRYKLDRRGKIYEHRVDNLAFNFPNPLKPAPSVLDLVATCPATPSLQFLWGPVQANRSSWVELYRAVRETLDEKQYAVAQDGLLAPPC